MKNEIYSDSPIFLALGNHLSKQPRSMHTPGHKGNKEFFEWLSPKFDLTELPDTDSLFEASGPIAEAEEKATRYFGSAKTVFSAGGCTLAIQAMIACACREGDKIIIDRCAHRSAVNACALLGLEPVWLWPDEGENGMRERISPEQVESVLSLNPDAKAVLITSPDYYGRLSDIPKMSEICKKYGALLLVDNAHGAHLKPFGLHPLELGADFTSCSAHKTLPVLTGGAFLSCANKEHAPMLKAAMALFGSTSPSYLIMQSLDLCRAWLEHGGDNELLIRAKEVAEVKKLCIGQGLSVPEGLCDPLRLTVFDANGSNSGYDLAEKLRENCIEPEYCDRTAVVLICTPFDADECDDLILGSVFSSPEERQPAEHFFLKHPQKVLLPRAAMLGEKEIISPEESIGRICAQAICACPPGIPIVMPGELIDEQAAQTIRRSGFELVEVCKKSKNDISTESGKEYKKMKLVYAIVNDDDSNAVSSNLIKSGFEATRLSSTGGFLRRGNTTFLIGVEDERVDELIELIRANSKQRKRLLGSQNIGAPELFTSNAIEVNMGGAVVFVTNIERFEKC